MNLYTSKGWLNVPALRRDILPFSAMWGGRGIGKTYGWLKDLRLDDPAPFILLRRTQAMIDLMNDPEFSPFAAIDRDNGCLTVVKSVNKYILGFYNGVRSEDGKPEPAGPPLGYAMALSTIHNIRGFSSDAEFMIYDEFIPEKHERPIQNEFDALMNAYETINRNRELQGRPPLKLVMLTNANHLGNPYFLGFGVIMTVQKMLDNAIEIWKDPARGLMLINIQRSPISKAKEDTALYKLTRGTAFYDMALGNEFSGDVFGRIGSIPLTECKPVVVVGELCIYRRKSSSEWYISGHVSGSPPVYGSDNADLARFCRAYPQIWRAYMVDNIIFQNQLCEILFRKYYNVKY